MHHLVFDTNILISEHFYSARMKILKRLIDAGLLTIYISEIVKREYLTNKYSEFKDKLKTKNLIDVDKFFVSDHYNIKQKLSQAEKVIKELYTDIECLINVEFNDWISDFKIQILTFESDKIMEVMDHYFTGGTVFKSVKSRKDISDAMICTSIENLSFEVETLNVLNNDKIFNTYLDSIHNINTFTSIQAFLDTDSIKKAIQILDKKDNQYELISSYLKSAIFIDNLINFLKVDKNFIDGIYLESENFTNMSILGQYVFYCTLEVINVESIINLKITKVELANEREYFLYFSFIAKGYLRFGTEYFEYLQLEKDPTRSVEFDNMKSDGATSVDEYRELELYGVITIVLNGTQSDNPEELIDYNSIEVDIDEAIIKP